MSLSDRRVKFTDGFAEPIIRYDEVDLKGSIKELKKIMKANNNYLKAKDLDEVFGERLTK